MGREQKSNKETKKKPALTSKEKKAALFNLQVSGSVQKPALSYLQSLNAVSVMHYLKFVLYLIVPTALCWGGMDSYTN